jgi:hypothetical protein
MPAISLVVCACREKDVLARLLEHVEGCCDDIVVVHDGPDEQKAEALVRSKGGRFYERPRAYQQEPHWPFAWGQARHDWILRLDADEFPSAGLKEWLRRFRTLSMVEEGVSGYTCIWPLWNGKRVVTPGWPTGRIFLFNKQAVRFFGMPEQVPEPDGRFEALPLVLEHQPTRSTYGVGNILLRPQVKRWHQIIAVSLLGKPTDLACWRWTSSEWPSHWEEFRRAPIKTALCRLVRNSLVTARQMLRAGYCPRVGACLNNGLNHFLIGVEVFKVQRAARPTSAPQR